MRGMHTSPWFSKSGFPAICNRLVVEADRNPLYQNKHNMTENQGIAPPNSLQPPERPMRMSIEVPYFYLKLKFWWYGFLFLSLLLLALTLGALGSPSWVQTGNPDYQVKGGLLRCANCPEGWSGRNYGSIADEICTPESEHLEFFCEAFTHLSRAGGAFIAFGVLAVLGLVCWVLKLVLYLKETECLGKIIWLGYVFPGVAAGSHVLALILWACLSNTSFSSECSQVSEVCSADGPGLALTVCIISPLAAGGFAFIYHRVKKEETNLMSPPSAGGLKPRQPAFFASKLNESNKEVEPNNRA